MWDHIINIHLSELLHTKTKNFLELMNIKKIKKMDNLPFLPNNNILTRLFKKLKKKKNIRMTINNI